MPTKASNVNTKLVVGETIKSLSQQLYTKVKTDLNAEVTKLDTKISRKLDVSGTAAAAQKLATARTIGLSGVVTGSGSFDGSGNLTINTTVSGLVPTSSSGNITIHADSDSSASTEYFSAKAGKNELKIQSSGSTQSNSRLTYNGYNIYHEGNPQISITGNAATATKLATARTITLGGDLTGSVSFDGGSNITLNAQVNDNSHNHSNYLPLSGGTMTGALTLNANPTANLHAATKQYVDSILSANDAMIYKGVIDASANPNYPSANAGFTYKISVAGRIGGANGPKVEIGDMIVCIKDSSASGDHATVGANWNILQNNIDGAVIGPTSSVANRVAVFDGTSGKIIKDSGYTIATSVPSNAKFTDTVTTVNNTLTSISTTEALSAAQGKTLKDLVDGKASTSHTHTSSQISDATNANTANMIVKRDGNGNFSAGTISASLSGNASSATKLQTARTIGVSGAVTGSGSFDGSGNLTITSKIKSATINGTFSTAYRTQTKGDAASGEYLTVLRNDTANVANSPQYGSGLAFGRGDTHGYFYTSYSSAEAYIGGGNVDKLGWVKKIAFTDSNITGNASTATKLQNVRTINGTNFDGSANITTANWGTARTITIGNSSKSVNGSANVAWSLSEIGAAAASHTHTSAQISDATNANTANMIVKRDGNGNFSAGTITASLSGNASTATKLQTARTISLGGILKGSASFDGSGNVTITASANDITTITKSLKVTTDWMDTGITGTNLASGTYVVQMYVDDGTNTSQWQETYSGMMSWFNGTTNSTDSDEILLHKAGHASNGRHVFLRTLRTSNSGYLKLQISCTATFTAASSIVFKFKKLI